MENDTRPTDRALLEAYHIDPDDVLLFPHSLDDVLEDYGIGRQTEFEEYLDALIEGNVRAIQEHRGQAAAARALADYREHRDDVLQAYRNLIWKRIKSAVKIYVDERIKNHG